MDVKVYSTPTCIWCKRLKDYLDDKGVKYENIDVSKNRDNGMMLIQKTGQTAVPVLEANGEFIVGFQQDKIDELLNL